jgi:hypothetical protein
MVLQKIKFQPGIYRESTDYSAEARWFDSNLVRFRDGFPEKINGWDKATSASFRGVCRDMRLWSALAGTIYVSIGTHLKYYAFDGGTFLDITPLRSPQPAAMAASPFAIVSGSPTMTVTHAGHGAIANDFVTYSGATTIGASNVTAAILNVEWQIATLVDPNTYTINLGFNADTTTSGGGTPTSSYQIQTGLDTTFYGAGWGAGGWGRGGWGSAADTSIFGAKLRLWSTWNYGEDIVFCARDSEIYYWDSSAGGRAVYLRNVAGANTVPTVSKEVAVSNERHVISFGCNPFNSSTQDTMLIRWSSKEDSVAWLPLNTNTAGDIRIPIGSYFVTHIQTSQEILVWSDAALHSMRYVGDPFIYGIDAQASKATIIGPKAKAVVNDEVYWMGNGRFYHYRGAVETLPCTVLEYVFNNLNQSQRDKIYCGTNITWNEITWFYPSVSSTEIDRYVTYNYEEKIWYYGSTLARTAWLDRPDLSYPVATDASGYLYFHDFGVDDGSTNPPTALPAYIESTFFEMGSGDNYMFVDKFIPDVTFRGASEMIPGCTLTVAFTMADWPGDANSTDGTTGGITTRSSTYSATVETYTNYLNLRMRGRMCKVRYSSSETDMTWRIGTPRINVRPDGKQ